jgi:sugar/nucleoside kinase (ribokinase family)
MSFDVVCVGLATLDTILAVPRHPGPDDRVVASERVVAGGGPAATAAVALARLGIRVAFAGAVGDDAAGESIREGIVHEGVDVSLLRVVPGAHSPQSTILVGPDGARAIVHSPGTAELEVGELPKAGGVHVDHVGYSAVRGRGLHLSLDGGNPVPDLDLAEVALYAPTEASLTVPNGAEHEATVSATSLRRLRGVSGASLRRLWGVSGVSPGRLRGESATSQRLEAAARAALAAGAGLVVVTRGARGSVALTREGELIAVPAPAVDPGPTAAFSTLGAGDVFHGALLAQLVRDVPLRDALAAANRIAADSCRALDGRSAIPTA